MNSNDHSSGTADDMGGTEAPIDRLSWLTQRRVILFVLGWIRQHLRLQPVPVGDERRRHARLLARDGGRPSPPAY